MTEPIQVTQRPTEEETLIHVAYVFAARSTCSRAHVGAVFALHGRILSTGYNGTPSGMPHCDHTTANEILLRRRTDAEERGYRVALDGAIEAVGCQESVHAEANAIAFAARHGVCLDGTTLYTTLTPCLKCAQLIVNVGVVEVVCAERYRVSDGEELLRRAGITVRVPGEDDHDATAD